MQWCSSRRWRQVGPWKLWGHEAAKALEPIFTSDFLNGQRIHSFHSFILLPQGNLEWSNNKATITSPAPAWHPVPGIQLGSSFLSSASCKQSLWLMVPAIIRLRWGLSHGVSCVYSSLTTNLISSSWSLAFTDKVSCSASQCYQDCCQPFPLRWEPTTLPWSCLTVLYLYDSEPGILQLSLPDSFLHPGMVLWELLFLRLLLLVALICVAPNLPSSPQICRLLFPLELEAVQLHVYEGQFHCAWGSSLCFLTHT